MEKIIVQGYISKYIYHNEQNGYSIASLQTTEEEKIVVVGFFPRLTSEVIYEFEGEYVNHPNYGKQLKVSRFSKPTTQSRVGIINYLSSDLFQGIGPKTAAQIVDQLGLNAIDEIIKDYNVLLEIRRMNVTKAKNIQKALLENHEIEKNLIGLYEFGLTGKQAIKLTNHYGASALGVILEDPFILMYEVEGFGFVRALDIAKKMGFEENDIKVRKAAVIYILNKQAFDNGSLYLNFELLSEYLNSLLNLSTNLDEVLQVLAEEDKIVLEEDKIFLKSVYHVEINVANYLREKVNIKNLNQQFSDDKLNKVINEVSTELDIIFTIEQQEAIKKAINNEISIITGGPGTGKTTIIAGIIKTYEILNGYSKEQISSGNIVALMAPTGRASKRMSETLRLPSYTIHKHLGYDVYGQFEKNKSNPISQPLIIIDEASMIDIFLANKLFDAIPPTTKIIIVGDKDQLPSVGPGEFLANIIESDLIEVSYLNQIHRQAEGSQIIELAKKINEQTLDRYDLSSGEEVKYIEGNSGRSKTMLIEIVKQAINKGFNIYDDIQVLIPMYKGMFGIDEVNKLLQEHFNPKKGLDFMSYFHLNFYVGDKVIQLRNDHERQVMNGDIGIVIGINLNEKKEKILLVSFENRILKYEQSDLNQLNLAYAISIHKAQGSEYPICIIPIFKNFYHMLRKELIYTGVTRSKKYLFLIGDTNLLVHASTRIIERRKTMLTERLKNPVSKDIVINDTNPELSPFDFMD